MTAKDSIIKIIEFLVGFLIVPRLITLIWAFLVPILGLSAQMAILANIILYAVLIFAAYKIKKMVAIGIVVGFIFDVVLGYLILAS